MVHRLAFLPAVVLLASLAKAQPFVPMLAEDVNPGPLGSSINQLLVHNGVVYFLASDAVGGSEIRTYNCTTGAFSTIQTNPNVAGGLIGLPTPNPPFLVGNLLIYGANNGTENELFSYNTATNTLTNLDLFPGASSSAPTFMVNLGSEIYARANTSGQCFSTASINGEAFRSDGTPAGTYLIKDINTNDAVGTNCTPLALAAASNGTDLGGVQNFFKASSGLVFFMASTGTNFTCSETAQELWVTDGLQCPNNGYSYDCGACSSGLPCTPVACANTFMVEDINPGGTNGVSPTTAMVEVGGKVYFVGCDNTGGCELWTTSATAPSAANTNLIADLNPGIGPSAPNNLRVLGNRVTFSALTTAAGQELHVTDGTTITSFDINPGFASSSPGNFLLAGSRLFFSATNATTGLELYWTNGVTVNLVQDLNPGAGSAIAGANALVQCGGNYYLRATDGSTGTELYRLDTLALTLTRLTDINPGAGNSITNNVYCHNGNLFIWSTDGGGTTNELYYSDDDGSTWNAVEVNPGGSDGANTMIVGCGDSIYFAGNNGTSGLELFSMYAPSSLLPAYTLSLSGVAVPEGILLNWQPGQDMPNSRYRLHKLDDHHSLLGQWQSAANPGQFLDPHPQAGINTYRLDVLDPDGRTELGRSVEVLWQPQHLAQLQVLGQGGTTPVMLLGAPGETRARLNLLNLQGQQLWSLEAPVQDGGFVRQESWPGLPTGTYLLQVQLPTSGQVMTTRLNLP